MFEENKMIKKLLLVALLSIFCASVHCNYQGQMGETADLLRQVCQPRFDIPDEQVFGARVGKFAEDKNFKCYVHCVLELLGVMKRNKVDYEKTIRQFDTLLPEEMKGPWKHAMNVCQEKVTVVKDKCDFAYNIIKCFHANNEKYVFA